MKLNLVPARTGIQWVKLGVRTFLKQPLALTGLFLMYAAALSVLWSIPVVGPAAAAVLMPAAALGLMVATSQAAAGSYPLPTVLISAFRAGRDRARDMLVLGGMYAVAVLLVIGLTWLLLGDMPEPADPADAKAAGEMARWLLVRSLIYLPVGLLFWHAPALVHWHGVSPGKSLFFSAVACLRNAGALIVFGLMWGCVILLASVLLFVIAVVVGNPGVVNAAGAMLFLALTTMISTSLYFTFRDSFRADGEAEAAVPPEGGATP